MKKLFLIFIAIPFAIASIAQTPLKVPALSPNAKIAQDFSLSNIEISYGRPSSRMRRMLGGVEAYGKPWRTGANGATKIKFGEDVEINNTTIKAGEYVLYTIPDKDKWEIILNTAATPFGPNGYDKANDVVRFTIVPKQMPEQDMIETFTINITNITYNTCNIELVWEATKIVIPVTAHNQETVKKNIDNAINHPSIPYFQAANYMYESNGNIDTAKAYVDKALKADPTAYYIWHLKAKIEKKLGNKAATKEAALKSMEVAKGKPYEEENKYNNTILLEGLNKQ